ncbi:MAG: hypothetical protein Q7W05_15375 [Deltaproteobacteria bacterium]|nr:hypothetical protein [Deltaproteobacteria bacterium]
MKGGKSGRLSNRLRLAQMSSLTYFQPAISAFSYGSALRVILMLKYLYTWLASVATIIALALIWNAMHPAPRMVRVDVGSILDAQKKMHSEKIKAGMSDEEQTALLKAATADATNLGLAVAALAKECSCAILNSAAMLHMSEKKSGIPDKTDRVRELIAQLAAQ